MERERAITTLLDAMTADEFKRSLKKSQPAGGLDANGLPLGLQLIGQPFEEETLFALAAVIEGAAGAFRPEPWWSASEQ